MMLSGANSRNRSKRSVVWGYFKTIDSESVQCLLCGDCLIRRTIQGRGPTTNMLRHLRVKHPTEVFKKAVLTNVTNGDEEMGTNGDFCSVEVVLEGGDSDMISTVNDADINSAINGILEAAQEGPAEQILHEEADGGLPVKTKCRKRSLIWRHFEYVEHLSVARCRSCFKQLQCFEGGSTSNLHRHMSTKHPKLFSQQVADGKQSSQGSKSKVEVSLEDEDSETLTTVNDTDTISSDHGILEAGQGQMHENSSGYCPQNRLGTKRSLIWRHFVHLKSLGAARCNICMKKLHYNGSNTSNMHRHMSKRHQELLSQLSAGRKHPPPPAPPAPPGPSSSQGSNMNYDPSTAAETVEEMEMPRQISGVLKFSRASAGEKRVFRREQELIEALRRVQREEARALEQQRELLEKLRAVNAREAAAEREQIEALRKAQREEAEDLNRQREEVQREKAELQKKWEELRQERDEIVLFPVNSKIPDSGTA